MCGLCVGLLGIQSAYSQNTYATHTIVENVDTGDRGEVVDPEASHFSGRQLEAVPSVSEVPNLAQTISVDLSEATLEESLKHIAAKANLDIGYLREFVAGVGGITIQKKSISAREALQQIVKDTNLRLVATTGKQLVLVERSPTEEIELQGKRHREGEVTAPTRLAYDFESASRPSRQQTGRISGTVTDAESGDPLTGVNVRVVGTNQGAATGPQGDYTISNVEVGTYELRASFVGYEDAVKSGIEVNEGSTTQVNFTLQPAAQQLEDVVVIGYGEQEEANVTGSVESIDGSEIEQFSVRDPLEALRGQMPGVTVATNSGAPGNTGVDIKIRGIGSINNTSPLVIVDGVRRGSGNVNPENIKSIEVLKDAASASIYGAQAANGVILITTKGGDRDQEAQVNFKSTVGVRSATDLPNMFETPGFVELGLEAYQNTGTTPPPSWQRHLDGDTTLASTNWIEEVFQPGVEHTYDLSVSGGSSDFNYFVAGGYEREGGIKYDNEYQRYTLRINSDFDVTDRIQIGETLNLSRSIRNPSATSGLPLRPIPVVPLRDEDNPLGGWGRGPDYWQGGNPVGQEHRIHQLNYNNSVEGNVYAQVDLLEGLRFKSLFGLDYGSNRNEFYQARFDWGITARGTDRFSTSFGTGNSYNMSLTLRYDSTFGNHAIEALAGYEAYKTRGYGLSAGANDYTVSDPRTLSLAGTTPQVGNENTTGIPYRLLSQFGRIDYSYDNRYLFQANIRRDASSKFSEKNKWGIFPGFSAGWRISNEAFMQDVDLISNLKLRGSWGILGSDQSVGNLEYQQTYNPNGRQVPFGNSITTGFRFSGFPNNSIKWEEVQQTDVGLNIGLLEDQVQATVNYYVKNTRDMLFDVTLPGSSGGSEIPVNIGKIQNRGLEMSLSYQSNIGDFSYDLSANASNNTNEVQKLAEDEFIFVGGAYTLNGNTSRTEVGHPISAFYGYKTEGIFRDQDQLEQYNNRGDANEPYQNPNTAPGDLIYKDLDGDGKVTPEDRTFIGNPWPTWTYGFNANMNYKGFSLSLFVQGVQDVDILNANKGVFENFFADWNSSEQAYDRWTPDNRDASQPRLAAGDPNGNWRRPSEYLVEDGSYLKLRRVNLGYTLPSSLVNQIGARNLRIFVSAENVLTLTGYSGLYPEITGSNTSRGVDAVRYPQTRLFSVGLNLGL